MKHIFKLFLIMALSFLLVSCQYIDRQKDLTMDELVEKIQELDKNNNVFNNDIFVDIEQIDESEGYNFTTIKGDISIYVENDEKQKLFTDLNIVRDIVEINLYGNYYLIKEDPNVYFDIDSSIGMGILSTRIAGQFYQAKDELNETPNNILDEFDQEELINDFLDKIYLLEDYEGLTMYQKGNYYVVELKVNLEQYKQLESKFQEIIPLDIEEVKDLDLEMTIKVVNNKLDEFSGNVLLETENEFERSSIKMNFSTVFGVEPIIFPSFDHYEESDLRFLLDIIQSLM